MSIDPFVESPLPFAEAARRLPRLRNSRPVSPATLWRWAWHGLRGVKLARIIHNPVRSCLNCQFRPVLAIWASSQQVMNNPG